MINEIQYRILEWLYSTEPNCCSGAVYKGRSKLGALLGNDVFEKTSGKTVIDFGCGDGSDAVELAQRGARHVIGIDIREEVLSAARQKAAESGVADKCVFAPSTNSVADVVISLDSFEHFANPHGILRIMSSLLKPDGEVLASFGPTWYHPLGGHLFSVFPWAHLIFTEKALIRWRSRFKSDGATRFGEVAGGLNQMTIRKFERLIENSPLEFASLELVPIRTLQPLHSRFTREFTTAIVRCRLVHRN